MVPQPGDTTQGREDGGGGDLRAAGFLKLHESEGAAQDGGLAEAPVLAEEPLELGHGGLVSGEVPDEHATVGWELHTQSSGGSGVIVGELGLGETNCLVPACTTAIKCHARLGNALSRVHTHANASATEWSPVPTASSTLSGRRLLQIAPPTPPARERVNIAKKTSPGLGGRSR